MRKKLLAGVMALALCSTNMPPQTIFAEEFTSGNLEEVTEETPEIFFDDNQDARSRLLLHRVRQGQRQGRSRRTGLEAA